LKVCYKVSLCEYCQQLSCKASIGLSIRAEMVYWGCPLLCENLAEADPPPSRTLISNQYSLIVPQPSTIIIIIIKSEHHDNIVV